MYASPTQPQTPSMASSSARPLQLDQWSNTKAPLTSSQRSSVNRLAEWLHRNSSDFKQQQSQRQQQPQSGSSSEPAATTNDVTTQQDGTTSTTEHTDHRNGASTSTGPIALPDYSAPLASAQSFLAWYTQLSDSVTSSTQSSHRQALERISETTSTADTLLAQLEACQVNVSELRAGTAFVQDSSRGIREQAQSLLDSQTHLDTLAEDIASRLSFFTLLPYATSMLSSPDLSIVYSSSFLELMDQLDMALLFLQQEPARSYRDAALYRMRYSQCVTRAATLAKMTVVRDIKSDAELTAERVKQVESTAAASNTDVKGKAREMTDGTTAARATEPLLAKDTADALFADASHQVTKLRPLIYELQKRASNTAPTSTSTASTAAEFESLLQECKTAWFQYRRPLLSRILLQRIIDIETQIASTQPGNGISHPIVQFARSATALLRYVLQNEFELYQQFFGGEAGTDQAADKQLDAGLGTYLSELSESIVSRLRPKLAKEEDLFVLAQASSAIADALHSGNDAGSEAGGWSRSLLPLLNETQSRLIARAQAVIAIDLAQFTPREEDGELDFPERITAYKLSIAKSLSTAAEAGATAPQSHRRAKSGAGLLDAALSASHAASSSKAQQEKVQLFTLPPALASTYYAPVGIMLELLYHLQARVPAAGFRRVATAAVEACLASVAKGGTALVKRKKGQVEKEDGWLFELRQMEILREAVVSAELVLKQAQDESGALDADAKATVGVGAGASSLVDLSSLVAAINSLWTNTGRLLYPSHAPSVPQSSDSSLDALSSAVSDQLQSLIERLATFWADALILPIRVYVDQKAPDADGSRFKSTYDAFETCIESIMPEKAEKVALWVEDKEVQRLLGGRVQERMGEVYGRFVEMKPQGVTVGDGVEEVKERIKGVWGRVLDL